MAAPASTIMPTKKDETGSRQCGRGKELYDENTWLGKTGSGNLELWTPPCSSVTHSVSHMLISFSNNILWLNILSIQFGDAKQIVLHTLNSG